MNARRKLGLHKENLTELTNQELQCLAGGHAECQSKGCGACLHTVVTCIETYTIATCTCPTGATCICPTQ